MAGAVPFNPAEVRGRGKERPGCVGGQGPHIGIMMWCRDWDDAY